MNIYSFDENTIIESLIYICILAGGWAFAFEVGYHLHKKYHIRIVFQDQAMYVRTSFRGAKSCKIRKKRMCFCHSCKFGKNLMKKLKKKKKKLQKRVIWMYFHSWKICA